MDFRTKSAQCRVIAQLLANQFGRPFWIYRKGLGNWITDADPGYCGIGCVEVKPKVAEGVR